MRSSFSSNHPKLIITTVGQNHPARELSALVILAVTLASHYGFPVSHFVKTKYFLD